MPDTKTDFEVNSTSFFSPQPCYVNTTMQGASTIFSQMKGATGDDGKYGVLDHLRFRVLLPLKSVFGLTAEEQQQKALYDTVSKVKAASANYFARLREIPLEHKKAALDVAKNSKEKGINVRESENKIAFFNQISLENLEKLHDVRTKIQEDRQLGKARLDMLSGFNSLISLAAASSASAVTPTQVINGLFDEMGGDQNKDNFLQAIRMEYVYLLLTAPPGGTPTYTITQFIDHFEALVEQGVTQGLGNEEQVREDFIRAAAYVINRSQPSADYKGEVEEYFNALQETYTGQKPDRQVVQNDFKSKIDQLIKGEVPITVDVLKNLSYEDKALTGFPISLEEFFKGDFEDFASRVEEARRLYAESIAAAVNLDNVKKDIFYINAEFNSLNQKFETKNISIDTKELSMISSSTLSDGRLKKILGDDEAQKVINQRNLENELKDRIKNDPDYKNFNQQFDELKKTFADNNIGLLEARQKMDSLNEKKEQLTQQLNAKKGEFDTLFSPTDEQARLTNASKIGEAAGVINNLKQEIEQVERNITDNRAVIDQLTLIINMKETALVKREQTIQAQESEIVSAFYQEKRIDPLNPSYFNVSQKALCEFKNFKFKGNIASEILKAVQVNDTLNEMSDDYCKKDFERDDALEKIYQQVDKQSSQARLGIHEQITHLVQTQCQEVYNLHQLSLYQDRLGTVSAILIQARNQADDAKAESDHISGLNERFQSEIILTETEEKCQQAVKDLGSKINAHEGLGLQLQAMHASRYFKLSQSREENAAETSTYISDDQNSDGGGYFSIEESDWTFLGEDVEERNVDIALDSTAPTPKANDYFSRIWPFFPSFPSFPNLNNYTLNTTQSLVNDEKD